jgi:hypothetical protein
MSLTARCVSTRGPLVSTGDTRPIPCGQHLSPRRWITERAWRMCSQQRGMQIRRRPSFMIAGGITRRRARASLRITERAKEEIKKPLRRIRKVHGLLVHISGLIRSYAGSATRRGKRRPLHKPRHDILATSGNLSGLDLPGANPRLAAPGFPSRICLCITSCSVF